MPNNKRKNKDKDNDGSERKIKIRECIQCGHKVESGDVKGEYKCAMCGYKNKIE